MTGSLVLLCLVVIGSVAVVVRSRMGEPSEAPNPQAAQTQADPPPTAADRPPAKTIQEAGVALLAETPRIWVMSDPSTSAPGPPVNLHGLRLIPDRPVMRTVRSVGTFWTPSGGHPAVAMGQDTIDYEAGHPAADGSIPLELTIRELLAADMGSTSSQGIVADMTPRTVQLSVTRDGEQSMSVPGPIAAHYLAADNGRVTPIVPIVRVTPGATWTYHHQGTKLPYTGSAEYRAYPNADWTVLHLHYKHVGPPVRFPMTTSSVSEEIQTAMQPGDRLVFHSKRWLHSADVWLDRDTLRLVAFSAKDDSDWRIEAVSDDGTRRTLGGFDGIVITDVG